LLSKKFIDTSGNKGEVVSSLVDNTTGPSNKKLNFTRQAAINHMYEKNINNDDFFV
jgi:hypothetical protein